MKKSIFGVLSLCALGACVMGVLNFPNQKNYSGLISENVEALAGPTELPELVVTCGEKDGQCWMSGSDLKFCGEYSYYQCVFYGSMLLYCKNLC